MRGYALEGEPAIHAVRAIRSALHGFVSLEREGGFGLPIDIDDSYDNLIDHARRRTGRDRLTPTKARRQF